MRLKSQAFLVTVSALALAATAARADVTISSNATANMSCAAGICVPTASDAVLNVSDLQSMLASGNVTVTTTGSGAQANNIDVSADLGWSANTLTLDAFESISVTAPITVKGKNGLSILTNDGGSGGELAFFGKGHVTFKKLSGKLAINGTNYTLVNSIASLAGAVRKNAAGDYALAANYDAKNDGEYHNSPIRKEFKGQFEGLGNKISNFTIKSLENNRPYSLGLFATLDPGASISDVALTNVNMRPGRKPQGLHEGALLGNNYGTVVRSSASGTVLGTLEGLVGGLIGLSGGIINECHADVSLDHSAAYIQVSGGLVGSNGGQVTDSYATGNVDGGSLARAGGLVGAGEEGFISNSYATGQVTSDGGYAGGLTGANDGDVSNSYSTGRPAGDTGKTGGLIGYDLSQAGSLSDTYWDTTTSGITNSSQGAGTPSNDPGITGLTTEQLQSGLPSGFDPSVWGENVGINNGLPYLLANPPEKK